MSETLARVATPRFHTLTIAERRQETADAISLRFAVPPALAEEFRFEPGQYLTLRAMVEGEDLRRSYSICSAPDRDDLTVAIKRVEGGVFSNWATDALKAGDTLEVMTPTGRFGLLGRAGNGRLHVGFAAGSGITPIMSIVQGVLAREPDSRFVLFYGSRSVDGILFRETLEDLKDRHLGRLTVFHVLSREEQDIAVLNGHLDDAKIRRTLGAMVPVAAIDHAFICGPEGMIEALSATLADLGLDAAKIHTERFVSALGGKPRAAKAVDAEAAPAAMATVIVDGNRRDVPVAAGEAILDAALRAGLDLPFACKGGMCCSCRAKLTEGSAQMELNYSLEPWEVAQGFILTCQAKPTTAKVEVDFDAV